jgi:hypothetical protein
VKYPIETGNFKLDGGAMFGVVPKPFGIKPIQLILIDIAARCLLIEEGNLILIDTGMGINNLINFSDTILYGDHIH